MVTVVLFFKQKPAYEMRISDWSSDVCSSDLADLAFARRGHARTVRTDQHGVRILRAQRGLDLDHVVDRDACGDADDHLDAGIGRFEDRIRGARPDRKSVV